MSLIDSFASLETPVGREFKQRGYTVQSCENADGLRQWREKIVEWFCEKTGLPRSDTDDIGTFLDQIHEYVSPTNINESRMHLYANLNAEPWARPTYFSFARSVLEIVLGNELVMQNRINVNIMMPEDSGSNISLHIDPHSGESPFQCVLWIPLTDTHETKGAFLLPPEANQEALHHFTQWMEQGGRERVMREIESELVWPKVPFGSFLLFSPTLMHGSVVNQTNETRWSFNTRFKALFTPYGSQEKGLGSFYLPIQTAPATHFGLNYTPPAGLGDE